MADIQLWEGGCPAQVIGADCGGCRENNCPAPHRMAAHRRRSPYLMGGAFDPTCDQRNRDCYCQLEQGDTVWLALVPEDSLVDFVRVKVTEPDAGGMTFSVVMEIIDLDTCEVIGPIQVPGSMTGIATSAQVARGSGFAEYTNPYVPVAGPPERVQRQGIRVGLRVDTAPNGGACNYAGRIELSVYAFDFETVQLADCRLSGSCVINNP